MAIDEKNGQAPRRRRAGIGAAVLAALIVGGGLLVIARGLTSVGPEPGPVVAGAEPKLAEAPAAGPVTMGSAGVVAEPLVEAEPEAAVRGPVGADVFPAAVPRVPKPAAVRGIYLNAWAAGSSSKLAQLIELAERTEINSFVIDVKEGGEISYRSGVGLARAIGAHRNYIPDVRQMLARLRERGIYPIARIVVFKDPVLAKARPEWAIRHSDGSVWRDNKGSLWVDPYNREVWDYNIALAREAVLLGFSEVQWDYVRFPDVPSRFMRTAVYPAQTGRTREQAIREFLKYSREKLADLNVLVTADVFGLTVSAGDDMGIGQRWHTLVDVTDALLPMVYPSHFARGSYGIPVPNADPYQTVKTAIDFAVSRTRGVANAAAIRPWLQDFSLGWPRYGAAEVRAQIQAVYDAGVSEWILWNPGSRYTAAALASADGVVPDLPIPRHTRPQPVVESAPTPPPPSREPPPLLGVPSGGGTRPDSVPRR